MVSRDALIEREEQLGYLEEVVNGSVDSGRVILLSGEAGFGKTSLLRAFVAGLDHKHLVLSAASEPVGIPAAFAPLFDLLDELPEDLRKDIRSGSGRPAVYAGMLDLIKNDRVILILEDMHCGDEATLGLIRYLGRRIGTTGSTMIVTYRSEEVDLAHPLRLVIADLGRTAERIELPPLSPSGVARLTEGLGLDPFRVHAATLGNPFFVEEVIRHPALDLPPTVGNAVLASAAQLPEPGLELVQLVALSPDGVTLDFLVGQAPGAGPGLDAAVQRKLLVIEGGQVRCRHDLIRESLLQAVPPAWGRDLHRRLLGFLEGGDGTSPDIARLAYHSIGAGEIDKAIRYSLEAARQAAGVGAHRQAAFHYSNALEFKVSMPAEVLVEALLEAAKEHCLINSFDEARDLAALRVDLMQSPLDRARAQAWLAYFESRKNDLEAVRREAGMAVEVLRHHRASEELALSLAVIAWVELVEGDREGAIRHGDQAIAVARAAGTADVEVHAATTAGTARSLLRDPEGPAQVESAVELGTSAAIGEFASRAINNLGMIALERGRLTEARFHFDRMIEYALAHELDAWYIAGLATRAWINVLSGRWSEADRDLEPVLGQRTCIQTEVEVLITAATLRARRGDPRSAEAVEDALDRIAGSTDHDALVMGCALAMEGAWMGLTPIRSARERYDRMLLSEALARDHSGRGILAYWARRLDLDPPDGEIRGAPGLEWLGDVAGAAELWDARGFAVHAEVTTAMIPGADLDAVFARLTGLGADGVIRGLRRELQRRGVKHIPRGENRATRQNPAGLTGRQAEVLALMASGLSNAAIAEELFITEKTASHHVSAVLSKLNASSRLQAVARATAEGWTRPRSRLPN